jgi:hypothetical protein
VFLNQKRGCPVTMINYVEKIKIIEVGTTRLLLLLLELNIIKIH